MIAHCIGSSSHLSHFHAHVPCVISLSVASDLFDISIHFFFLISISLITLFFLPPDNFNFHDVVDKYPAHFRLRTLAPWPRTFLPQDRPGSQNSSALVRKCAWPALSGRVQFGKEVVDVKVGKVVSK